MMLFHSHEKTYYTSCLTSSTNSRAGQDRKKFIVGLWGGVVKGKDYNDKEIAEKAESGRDSYSIARLENMTRS